MMTMTAAAGAAGTAMISATSAASVVHNGNGPHPHNNGNHRNNGIIEKSPQESSGDEDNEDQSDDHEDAEPQPEVDIVINNVVCSFSVRCHLNLRDIALRGLNVEYKKENGMVTMKLRRPYTTASMWSSGKITCTGANSEDQAKVAAKRYARILEKLGFNVRFRNFRVVNVLGTCTLPFAIKITQFSQKHRDKASYEPELHPGVTYKIKEPKATLKIYSTGSITVTAPSVKNVQSAIEHIYDLVSEFRKPKTVSDKEEPIPVVETKHIKSKKSHKRQFNSKSGPSTSTSFATSTGGPRKKSREDLLSDESDPSDDSD